MADPPPAPLRPAGSMPGDLLLKAPHSVNGAMDTFAPRGHHASAGRSVSSHESIRREIPCGVEQYLARHLPPNQYNARSTSRADSCRSHSSWTLTLSSSTRVMYLPYLPEDDDSVIPSRPSPTCARRSYTAMRAGAAATRSADASASPTPNPGSGDRADRPAAAAAGVVRAGSRTLATAAWVTVRTCASGSNMRSRTHLVSARSRFQKSSAPMSAFPMEVVASIRPDTSAKTSSYVLETSRT